MGKRILDFLLYIRPEPDRIEFLERLRLMVLYALIVPAIVSTVYNVMLVIRAGRYAVALLLCLSLIVGSLALVSFFRTRRLSGARRFMGLGFFLGSTLTILDAGGLYGLGSLYFLVAFAFGYLLFDYFMALALPVYFFAGFALRLQWGDFHPQSIYNDPDIATRVLIPFALSSFLGVVGNFSMRQLEERLSSLAYRDQATGLPNRAKFEELLRDEVVRSKESGRGFTLYAFKLHHLSRISGNRGVDYLNEVLQSFVDRMHDLCFPHGIVGRISESIFGLVLPEEPAADGRAREMIETLYDPLRGRDSIEYLQLSCGILRYPEDNIAPAELNSTQHCAL
ncbi:MAG: GGDEF domain-containing protein [Spirochaetales bacterium]|nr:GGDEF domain-containing protein [Spirochaetales bacterium]